MSAKRVSDAPTPPLSRAIRTADALTIALVIVAAFTMLHPVRADFFGVTIRIRQWWRLLLVAAVIVLGRHRVAPRPSLRSRLTAGWARTQVLWPALMASVPIVVTTRLLVLLIGYFSVITFGLKPDAPREMGWAFGPELPLRWDAGWYLGIIGNGYYWTGSIQDQQNLNFFPAYPLAARFVSWAIHVQTVPQAVVQSWTATTLSIVAFLAACVYLHRLVAPYFGKEVASGTVLLIATYPFALFYSAVYPEALFLLCAVGAWYHLEREQVVPAVLWGLIAGLTRPNGGLLAIALGVWVLVARRPNWRLCLVALAPIVGTLLYSVWAYRLTGHPFVWAELQRSAFMRTYRGLNETLWMPLRAILDLGLLDYIRTAPWEMTNLIAALLGVIALWPVTSRLGLAAGVFVGLNVFVPLLNGGLVSMGRYTAVLFPMFIWLALVARGQSLALLASCFALCQGILAALFFTWRPIF
jgi:hypothetical protein